MKKFSLLFAFVISLLISIGCCSSINKINTPPTNLIHHLKNSTITLVNEIDEGVYVSYCGGVWISQKYLVTAKHCVQDDNLITFQAYVDFDNHYPISKNEKVYQAKVVVQGADDEDIAILYSLHDVKHDIATLGTYNPQAGQTVHHIGHPSGLQFTYMKCVVSGERFFYSHGYERHILHIVGFIWFGSSGGGGFDDQGNLIGITSMIHKAPGQAMFIHPQVIKSILDKNKIEYHTLD